MKQRLTVDIRSRKAGSSPLVRQRMSMVDGDAGIFGALRTSVFAL
jgi:hypothetical protein